MKRGTVLVAVVLLSVWNTVALAEQRFVDVSGDAPNYFQTDDGCAWIPVGCNICFERLYGTDGNDRSVCEARYFARMRTFAANGGNFLRIWLGHPFFEVMPSKAGEFDSAATETLKKTVRLAEELGIKIKFTLESFRSVLPPEKVGGGMYAAFFNRPLYAPYAKDMRGFFASEKCAEIYLAKARYLKSLGVGDSPSVICWELWNEINATGPVDAYEEWSNRMLAALRTLFPRQMVTQNLGSFSDVRSFQDYDYLGRVSDNAFLQVHRYLDPGASLDVCRGPMDVLCAEAVRELRDRRPDRPAVLAEVGAVRANHTGPSDLYEVDTKGMLLHDEIFAPFFAGAAGCGQPWHWDHQYLDRHELWYHFARFAKAVDGLDPITERFRPFRTETKRLRIYGLKGRRTTLLWCRDKANTWETEYRHGIAPETLRDIKLPFESGTGFHVYLPWKDQAVSLPPGRCVLPPFQRSCVVRFTESPENKEMDDYTFLKTYMPEKDRATVSEAYLRKNVALAQEARATAPWRDQLTDEIFREYILPYSSIGEDVDDWRPLFREKFWPLVKSCRTTTEAVQIINSKIWNMLDVHYSTKRDKADQSPFHSMRIHMASCTGLAIIQIDAYRACGIPARFTGCCWTPIPGNHSWPEFWDNGNWHFFSDAVPDKFLPLDEAWFTSYAAQADGSNPRTKIYATRWSPNGTYFWATWRGGNRPSTIPADDVTESYKRFRQPLKAARIAFVVRNAAGRRVPGTIRLIAPDTQKLLAEGVTYDESHDLNDHLILTQPERTRAVIQLKQPDGSWKQVGFTTFDAQQKLIEVKTE